MAQIRLYDGTNTSRAALLLQEALDELGRHIPLDIDPKPTIKDSGIYGVISSLIRESYDTNKNGIDVEKFFNEITRSKEIKESRYTQNIILVEPLLVSEGVDFGGGVTTERMLIDYMIVSSGPILRDSSLDDALLFHRFVHELGHLKKATPPGRSNIVINSFGNHCLNDKCVMQRLSFEETVKQANLKYRKLESAYCNECIGYMQLFSK